MKTFLLLSVLFLPPSSSWGQQTTSSRRRSSGQQSMAELPCPKGFTAQAASGPHLAITSAPAKTNRRQRSSFQSAPASKTPMGRRCVADKPKKAATNPAKTTLSSR